MADISKITTPDGTTYDIKDATARNQSGVTGVKGSSETTYRTGNVDLSASDLGLFNQTAASGGTTTSLVTTGEKYTWNNKTSNTGTVTSVATGAGLTGGTITGTGTIKADLKSETKSTLEAASMGSTPSRQYAVGLDKNGDLSVNVPWTDNSTTYSIFEEGIDGLVPGPEPGQEDYVLYGDGTWDEPPDTHHTGYLRAGASGGTSNAATTSGNTYLNYVENGSNRSGVKLVPGNNMTITSDASGNVTFASSGGGTSYSAGTGLSLSGTTINHSNSVTAGTAGTSSATSGTGTLAVPYVTYDAQGHVTGSGTHTHTITNNVTGTGTSGYLTQWSGTNTVSSSGIKIVTGRTSQFTCAKENTTTAPASHSGFSSTPKVIGTFYNVSNTTNQLVLMITAQSATSTTFTIRNNGTAQRTGYVDWIAIGT